jgi:hypothetical protein
MGFSDITKDSFTKSTPIRRAAFGRPTYSL